MNARAELAREMIIIKDMKVKMRSNLIALKS